jgi:hypothetical protein
LGWDSETSDFLTDNFPYSAQKLVTKDQSQSTNPAIQNAKNSKIFGA